MKRKNIEDRGAEGEEHFLKWLKAAKLPYLYVKQDQKTFVSLFSDKVKRPDFLVLLNSIGFLAVDVKNKERKPFYDDYTLDKETEIKRALAFERIFRIPVWYAFYDCDKTGIETWHWISALRAIEVAGLQTTHADNKPFLTLDLKHFEQVQKFEDLGKLFLHTLSSIDNLVNDIHVS